MGPQRSRRNRGQTQPKSASSTQPPEKAIAILNQTQFLGTTFAALLGLAFGSFLNVLLARFPEGESVVAPRSHCRQCDHVLAWWENIPLASWLVLRGRCRVCQSPISLRYPFVELLMGLLWAACWLKFSTPAFAPAAGAPATFRSLAILLGSALFCWLVVALAALDAEFLWLPDMLTLPGIGLGFLFSLFRNIPDDAIGWQTDLVKTFLHAVVAIAATAGIVLLIRLAYWLVRRQEGMGLGDAKLMAMLGAWLGLRGAMESFTLAVFAAAATALIWLAILAIRRNPGQWAKMPLPLGTFLCAAALVEVFYPHWLWTWLNLDVLMTS